jgi:hypothetical protein
MSKRKADSWEPLLWNRVSMSTEHIIMGSDPDPVPAPDLDPDPGSEPDPVPDPASDPDPDPVADPDPGPPLL